MKGFIVRLVLTITGWRWVRWIFTQTKVGRRVSLRFVAGETLAETIEVARTANANGMPVSLNLLGEHVHDVASARASAEAYGAALTALAESEVDGNISVKLTQLGLGFDNDLCAELLDQLARQAQEIGTTITVDMEDSTLTDVTLDLYESAQRTYGNLGVALQAYLKRTPSDLQRIAPLGGHIRLCKGAYDEPDSVAFRSRGEVDAAYDELLTTLMGFEEVLPAIATHDDVRVGAAIGAALDRTAPYEFQMLYGIRVSLQEQLVADGYALRSYIPYGSAWYPYLTRRMAERPANLWFFIRALFGR